MISAYKFRLYPDEEQEKTLDNQLRICKELYNGAYRERLEHYEKTGRGLTYAEQAGALPEIKKKTRNWRRCTPRSCRMSSGDSIRRSGTSSRGGLSTPTPGDMFRA